MNLNGPLKCIIFLRKMENTCLGPIEYIYFSRKTENTCLGPIEYITFYRKWKNTCLGPEPFCKLRPNRRHEFVQTWAESNADAASPDIKNVVGFRRPRTVTHYFLNAYTNECWHSGPIYLWKSWFANIILGRKWPGARASRKIMFLWMVKSLKFIVKNKCFWWFRRLHVRTEKVSQKHQNWDLNPFQNRWKIDTSFMLEKGIPKTWKFIKQVIKKGGEKWENWGPKNGFKNIWFLYRFFIEF